jgi:hypothetical protein
MMSEHEPTPADPVNSRIEDADVCEHEGIKRRKLTPPCDNSLAVVEDHVAAFLVHERLEPDELDLLVAIINEHPELAMRKFVHKCGTLENLPLYHLCKFKPTLDHVRTVYAAFPLAIQVPGLCNLLPLHAYIAEVEDADIIEFLVNEYPNALEHQADYRMTPIHLLQYSNFTTPEITQVLVKRCPEVVLQRCELGTTLHLALLSRYKLTDEADLFLNEESLKIMAEACPTALKVLDQHYGKEVRFGRFELRQLPLFVLLDGKPTMDLVELFVSGFSAALRIEERDEDGAIINILQGALRDSRLSLGIKRSLIRGSVLGHKMVFSLYELSAEVAAAIIEEADAHPMVNELEIAINASRYAVSDTTHTAMIEALAETTSLTRFWYVPNAFTTRLRLPDSANKLLSNFFARNTPVEDLKLGLSYHSSAFDGLAENSNIRELKVSIQEDSTDDLAGLATALKVNDTISTVILHTETTAAPWPLLDAFTTNKTLERFYMHGPPLPNEFSDALLEVLATRNVTLQHCVSGNREERIDHYCALNRTGRRIIRKPETTKEEFVDLIKVRIDNVNILFGLLSDVPALWST